MTGVIYGTNHIVVERSERGTLISRFSFMVYKSVETANPLVGQHRQGRLWPGQARLHLLPNHSILSIV